MGDRAKGEREEEKKERSEKEEAYELKAVRARASFSPLKRENGGFANTLFFFFPFPLIPTKSFRALLVHILLFPRIAGGGQRLVGLAYSFPYHTAPLDSRPAVLPKVLWLQTRVHWNPCTCGSEPPLPPSTCLLYRAMLARSCVRPPG